MNYYPIFKRELKSYFGSWIAYIISSVFLIMSGFFFYTDLNFFILWKGQDISEGLWQYFFLDVRFIILIMVPLLTMRLLSEEKKRGTIEILFTLPLKDSEIILGKYCACVTVFVVMLSLTIPYSIILSIMQPIDFAPVAAGYLGLFLLGCSFISIGIFISSLTENDLVSAFVTFVILSLFWFISWNQGAGGETINNILLRISLFDHFLSFARGVVETKDIIYNLIFSLFFLFLTLKSLESRKWLGNR